MILRIEYVSMYLGIEGGDWVVVTFLPGKKGGDGITGTLVEERILR
jgi:hypothetical protein